LVDYFFGQILTSEKRTNFTHGMTSLTMITADEWAGMAFTLLLLIQTDVGYEVLNKAGSFGEDNIIIDEDNWPEHGLPDVGGEADEKDITDDTINKVSHSTVPLTHSNPNTKGDYKVKPDIKCSRNTFDSIAGAVIVLSLLLQI
jgi:hypothetical protein